MTNPLPILESEVERTEYGFKRTKCDCWECSIHCKFMPGSLAPADVNRMHKAIAPNMTVYEFADQYLLASPGATLRIAGTDYEIPSLVPRANPDMSCIFLNEGRCSIHAVSPYGCAFFDGHMSDEEGNRRSKTELLDVLAGTGPDQVLYKMLVRYLAGQGKLSPGPAVCKRALEKSLELPYAPETLATMRARYAEAVAPVFNIMHTKEIQSPGYKRAHVFDFHHGMRLTVSIDCTDKPYWVIPTPTGARHINTKNALHMSMRFLDGTELADAVAAKEKDGKSADNWLHEYAIGQFRTLSGYVEELLLLSMDLPGRSYHWFGEWLK